MKSWKSFVALTALALVLPLAVHAQGSDPAVGTWKLNVAKSKFDTGPAPQSETRTFAVTPDGIHETVQLVTATGDTQSWDTTFKRDGKPYPETGNPNNDALAVTRPSPLKFKVDLIRAGKIIGHVTVVESRNHKTMTFDTTYTSAAGQSVHSVTVFDRQ